MHPEYKLIRFSNGDKIIGEVLEEKPHVVRVRNMFRVVNRESRQGYVTGIIGWLSFLDEDEVLLNREHVTFISKISGDVVEYIKNRDDEDEEPLTIDEMEQQYKEAMMNQYLRFANTNPTMN